MEPLGATLAAIFDEEAGNITPPGASICRNYLIVRGWTGGSDLAQFFQLPWAPHVRCRRVQYGPTKPQQAVLLLDRACPTEENVI